MIDGHVLRRMPLNYENYNIFCRCTISVYLSRNVRHGISKDLDCMGIGHQNDKIKKSIKATSTN